MTKYIINNQQIDLGIESNQDAYDYNIYIL